MNRLFTSAVFIAAALTSTGGVALASKTVIKTKGMDASGSFDVRELVTCAGGSTALNSTSVHIDMFESATTTNGSGGTVLQASISVSRFDGCNFVSSFGFGLFQGIGTLQMTGLQSGKITGKFVLDDGTRLDVNLTLAGSDTSTLGISSQRTILGKTMTLQRSVGTSRTATLAGTVTVDGHAITAAKMENPSGMLARNTGGQLTIIKP